MPSHRRQNSSSYLHTDASVQNQRACAGGGEGGGAHHQCPLAMAPHSLRQGSVLPSQCMQRYAQRKTTLRSVIIWSPNRLQCEHHAVTCSSDVTSAPPARAGGGAP